VRDHVATTLRGVVGDMERLSAALTAGETGEPVGAALDLVDRFADERAWLRAQPISSLFDDAAREILTAYRIAIATAHLAGERWLLSREVGDLTAWTSSVGKGLRPFFALVDDLPE
jgi:hypothetical protein